MEDMDFSNYSLTGVLQFISEKFHEFDRERIKWNQEKEELNHKLSNLESEKSYLEQQLVDLVNATNPHFDDYSSSLHLSSDARPTGGEAPRYRSISRMTATRKVLQRYLTKYETDGNTTPRHTPTEDLPSVLRKGSDSKSDYDISVSRRPVASYSQREVVNGMNGSVCFHSLGGNGATSSALTPVITCIQPLSLEDCHELPIREDTVRSIKETNEERGHKVNTSQVGNTPEETLETEPEFEDMEDVDLNLLMQIQKGRQDGNGRPVDEAPPTVTDTKGETAPTAASTEEAAVVTRRPTGRAARHSTHSPALPVNLPLMPDVAAPATSHVSSSPIIATDKPTPSKMQPQRESAMASFPLDEQIDKISQIPRYSVGRVNMFHLAPVRYLQFSESAKGALLSVDQNNIICVWETPNSELCINASPSQVIYGTRQSAPILAATWVNAINAVATSGSDGSIYLYRMSRSTPSSTYLNGAVHEVVENVDVDRSRWNGMFDRQVSGVMNVMSEHSDAVWALYNNEAASDSVRKLLFSASASGSLLAHDLEREQCVSFEVKEYKTGLDTVTSIVSNSVYDNNIFCGHISGCMSMIDIETRKVVRVFNPVDAGCSLYPDHDAFSNDSIFSIDIHPTLPLLVAGTKFGNIHLFDIRDPTVSASFRAHADSVSQVSFHPWFNTIVSAGYDGSVRLWCAHDRVLMHQYHNFGNGLFDETGLKFSISGSNGSVVIGGSSGALHCFT